MKSMEQIQHEINKMKEAKLSMESYYHDLDGTDDEGMISYLSDLDMDIHVLEHKIKLLNWVLKG